MQIRFDPRLADGYKSASQRIRVLTEAWVGREIFCPACGEEIAKSDNNSPVLDFNCLRCREEYELKSSKIVFSRRIVDGAYATMIERLQGSNNPNFFLLNYSPRDYEVSNFFVIPKHFFVPEIIEKRKPLSESARRSRWVGCNIVLQSIPQTGKIFYVKDKQIQPREAILQTWKKTLFLREEKEISAKGWVLDVMKCVDSLAKKEFTLDEVYGFEQALQSKHPGNKHIKDKIRQQLQLLRDKGYLEFKGKGQYRVI
ncbi:MAG TPA: restriction endonuclease [Elusimicrobia bacterium]|nr:restriction endonuclease [Elusimicrobiota bacterium]